MTIEEAVQILKKMRDEAKAGQVAVQAVFFGLKYANDIEGMSAGRISLLACGHPNACQMEINYGRQLAELLNLKK